MGDFKRKIHPDYQSDQTIKPTEKAADLNALLAKIHQMKCEFNEKVFVIKEEKVEVTARLEKLTKKLVDIQYLLINLLHQHAEYIGNSQVPSMSCIV